MDKIALSIHYEQEGMALSPLLVDAELDGQSLRYLEPALEADEAPLSVCWTWPATGGLRLSRLGAQRMALVLDATGQLETFSYETPYGAMDFTLEAIETEAGPAHFRLAYRLLAQGSPVGHLSITLHLLDCSGRPPWEKSYTCEAESKG